MSLNPHQDEAMRYIDGPLLVLAGAGSGKTRVITRKIAHLVQQCGIAPHQITAVTFTNKAAREMKQRVGELLKGKESRGLRVSTFHTLGLSIIRQELVTLGYKEGFSIFDANDCQTLIRELLRREGANDELTQEMQSRISNWKNRSISPEQAAHDEEVPAAPHIAALYANYNRHLKAYNAVDFDDLLRLPLELFESHPDILDKWQDRIRYLLVDEYQDTNTTQYRLVQLLVGVRGALTVVGDDDQSIYAWRGAEPENLALLKDDFPNLKVIKMEQNYRSMGRILHAANQLIANNSHVFEKKLWSDKGYGEEIKVVTAADEDDEAAKVVSRLIGHRFQSKCDYSDYAILYRGNYQSRPLEKALREYHIPYYLSGGTSFFAYTEVKDIMAYMRLISNLDDDTAFLRVVNTPRREIGATTLEKLGNYAGERGITLFSACSELGIKELLSTRAYARLSHFCDWITELSEQIKTENPVQVVRDLVKEIDYLSWLNDTTPTPKGAERKMENVLELIAWLQRMVDEIEDKEKEEIHLGDLVARLSLFDILDRQNSGESGDTVRLMTLHTSKGLEFPHLFLVGMEEELLPHRTSIEEDNIEEERRLAYVGITRAQETLTITRAARRRRGGELVRCQPSRFLEELPQDDLYYEGQKDTRSKEEKQQHGKAQLANLKAMLGD